MKILPDKLRLKLPIALLTFLARVVEALYYFSYWIVQRNSSYQNLHALKEKAALVL